MNKKILIATGGTGGHVFPAQELAKGLGQKGFELLFAGGKLNSNKYFKHGVFPHQEVSSERLFRGNFLWLIGKGIWEGLRILRDFSPDLVVGFGSFYTFPILVAAKIKKVPIVLFEPNAIPGKVNRFFSRWAMITAIQFSEASKYMKGSCIEVKMPTCESKRTDPSQAREYFYLAPDRFTFLVFGGSQGSQSINHFFSEAMTLLNKDRSQFQIIHVTGKSESAESVRQKYKSLGIRSCVKVFEDRMDLAWSAANLVVCRSGAATLAEQIAFEVPGILIPFPQSADDHQMKNALFIEKQVGGAVTCSEKELNVARMNRILEEVLNGTRLKAMHKAILEFKKGDQKSDLCSLICQIMNRSTYE